MSHTICIIEDDQGVRISVARILNRFGYQTKAFASAEEFWREGIAERPSCFLLDINLPGASGIEFCQVLSEELGRIPVILITGSDTDGARRAAIAANCVAYLTKPVPAGVLLEALAAACGDDR